jgi:LPS-assembly lipoprotein
MSDRRTILRLTGTAGLALALGACFRPLYGPQAAGGSVAELLADTEVEVTGDRLAHYLKNEIEFQLTGGTVTPAPKRYKLTVWPTERLDTIIIDRTGGADAATLTVDARYSLSEKGKPAPVTSGEVRASASYERSGQRFASVRAARDAQIRNAKLISEQIKTRLALALSGGA